MCHIVERCPICQKSEDTRQHQGVYTPLPIPESIWEDLSVDFVLNQSQTQRSADSIMVAVDHFSKIAHFVGCKKKKHFMMLMWLNFTLKEIVRLHGIPASPPTTISSLLAVFGGSCRNTSKLKSV